MTELAAGLIDVFAARLLSGNPLAVVEKGDILSEAVGLWEDAATGTAAGPLAAYLNSLA